MVSVLFELPGLSGAPNFLALLHLIYDFNPLPAQTQSSTFLVTSLHIDVILSLGKKSIKSPVSSAVAADAMGLASVTFRAHQTVA